MEAFIISIKIFSVIKYFFLPFSIPAYSLQNCNSKENHMGRSSTFKWAIFKKLQL